MPLSDSLTVLMSSRCYSGLKVLLQLLFFLLIISEIFYLFIHKRLMSLAAMFLVRLAC